MHDHLTVHAILRYLERVDGVDMETIRQGAIRAGYRHLTDRALWKFAKVYMGYDEEMVAKRILTPKVKAAIKAGAKRIRLQNCTLQIYNNAIVTVTNFDAPKMQIGKPRRQGWKKRALEEVSA